MLLDFINIFMLDSFRNRRIFYGGYDTFKFVHGLR